MEQYFDHSVAFALLAAAVLSAPLLVSRLRPTDAGTRRLVVVAAVWVLAPTAVLLVYSAVSQPLYYPRYLCFTAPAMALLLAVSVVAVARSREWITAALAVFAAGRDTELHRGATRPVRQGRHGLQPGGRRHLGPLVPWRLRDLRQHHLVEAGPHPAHHRRPSGRVRPPCRSRSRHPGGAARIGCGTQHLGIWGVADQVRRCTVLWTVSERDPSVPSRQSGPTASAGAAVGPRPGLPGTRKHGLPHRRTLAVQLRSSGEVDPVSQSRRARPKYTSWVAEHGELTCPVVDGGAGQAAPVDATG